MIRLLHVSLLILLLSATLIACSASNTADQDSNSFIIDKSKNFEYIIIYGKNAGDAVVHQASLLCNELKEKCNVNAYTQSDSEYRQNDSLENQGPEKTMEILLGTTNRNESIELYNSFEAGNEYIIKAKNEKLVIGATTEQLLVRAIERFKAEYLSKKQLKVIIPEDTELRDNSYSFFDIAKKGYSNCTVVIPENSSSRIKNMATSLTNKINNLCETNIKVAYENEIDSTENCILIGNLQDVDSQSVIKSLRNNQSVIKIKNSKLIIAGYSDTSLINGIFSFIGNIIMNSDKCPDGSNYLYFPLELELTDTCNHIAPNVPGGILASNSEHSNNLYSITYTDVTKEEFNNYVELIKNLNFIVTTTPSDENDVNNITANYNYIDSKISIEAMLHLTYKESSQSIEMTLSYEIKSLS